MPQGRGDLHHPLAVVVTMARCAGGGSLWPPPLQARHVRFCQVLNRPISLDEHTWKFLTVSVPTDQSDTAPALAQQGLQPILLKRQWLNPSSVVRNFRQGLSRAGLGCWPFWTEQAGQARSSCPRTRHAAGFVASYLLALAQIRPEPVQNLLLCIRRQRAAPASPTKGQAWPSGRLKG